MFGSRIPRASAGSLRRRCLIRGSISSRRGFRCRQRQIGSLRIHIRDDIGAIFRIAQASKGHLRAWRKFARRGEPLVERRSEEHTSELQSLMRISYAVFCLNKKNEIHLTNDDVATIALIYHKIV